MFQTKPHDVVKLSLEKETSNGWSQGPWLEPCCCILPHQLIFALMSGDNIISCRNNAPAFSQELNML